jgi:hypothetical protein
MATKSKKDAKAVDKAPKAAKSVEDVDFDGVEGTVAEKPKATKTKEKPTKEAKAEKPKKTKTEKVEEDDLPVPAGMVRWPFKRGSVMRYMFQTMLEGCNAKNLEKEIEGSGHNWKLMLRVFRSGLAGAAIKTHKYKLNEEGGRFKITDVKYIGPKDEKPAKVAEKTEKASKKAKAEETDDDE